MRTNYRDRDVRYLIEGYESLKETRDTKPGAPLNALVALADLGTAMHRLTPDERGALLLVGFMGFTMREAASLLGVTAMTVSRRYGRAREEIVNTINGGT